MKKLKLFLSICTLCLSLAVMCIGIYAAQTVTYTISGTISYTVEDVFVEITTKVYKVSEKQDVSTMTTNATALATTSFSNIDTTTYTLTQELTVFNSSTSITSPSENIDIAYGKNAYTYYIVINIKNLTSSKSVSAYIENNTTATTNSNTYTNTYQNNITSTETRNIIIAYSLSDEKTSITSTQISYTLNVSYTEYSETLTCTIGGDTISFTKGQTWAEFCEGHDGFYVDTYGHVCYMLYGFVQYEGSYVDSTNEIVSTASYTCVDFQTYEESYSRL